jgi:hypothetical protein
LDSVVRGPSTPRGGPGTFVCRILAVTRCAIPSGSVEITRSVVTRLSLPVTQARRDVAILCRQPGLPAPHSCQLVGAGILAVLCRLRAILGRNLAVVDGLGAVVGSLGVARGGPGAFT